jgi:hypothetical protein
LPRPEQTLHAPASIGPVLARFDDHLFPAIVIKAREDADCRLALAQLGYFRVRSSYARQWREGRVDFAGLEDRSLSPTMEFVDDWLREERRRMVARARWPFLVTMVATVVAGIAFMAVAVVLG